MKSVMILDGNHPHALAIAAEIKQDFPGQIRIMIMGSSANDLVLRSRYCDVPILGPHTDDLDYKENLKGIITKHAPDVVIPVGFRSTAILSALKEELKTITQLLLPTAAAVEVALSKTQTLDLAKKLGIRVPYDFTLMVRKALKSETYEELSALPYPVFLKHAQEIGGNLTGVAKDAADLISKLNEMAAAGYGDEILVQEYVAAESITYGCALLYFQGEAILEFQHAETRSIPRLGGSATRAHIEFSEKVSAASRALLEELDWEGAALVEFKKDIHGQMVLMEINPKYWASYALASRNGYRFGSTSVSKATGLALSETPTRHEVGQMVFPLREWAFAIRHRSNESILQSIWAMLFPPTTWDIQLSEVPLFIRTYISRFRGRVVSRMSKDDGLE